MSFEVTASENTFNHVNRCQCFKLRRYNHRLGAVLGCFGSSILRFCIIFCIIEPVSSAVHLSTLPRNTRDLTSRHLLAQS